MNGTRTLTLGIGTDSSVSVAELLALVSDTLAAHSLSPRDIACVVSLDSKRSEPALHELARTLDVPARFFDAATLRVETPRLKTPSPRVETATGVAGIAEAAALAAAGPDSELIVPKTKSPHATCAVARRVAP